MLCRGRQQAGGLPLTCFPPCISPFMGPLRVKSKLSTSKQPFWIHYIDSTDRHELKWKFLLKYWIPWDNLPFTVFTVQTQIRHFIRAFWPITSADHELCTRWHLERWRGHSTCCGGVDMTWKALAAIARAARVPSHKFCWVRHFVGLPSVAYIHIVFSLHFSL